MIGHYAGSSTPSDGVTGALQQSYKGGSICDLTGEPRRAKVSYTCQRGTMERVMSVTESSVCIYDIAIVTSLLCPKEKSKLSSPKALCYPIDDNGTPIEKPTRALDDGGVEALSAISLAGSKWSGTYDCQGEQWFTLRVHKQWLWDPTTAPSPWKHAAACENFQKYRIRPTDKGLVSREYWDVERLYILDASDQVMETYDPFSSGYFGEPKEVLQDGKHGFSHKNAFVKDETYWGGRIGSGGDGGGAGFYIGASVDYGRSDSPPAKLLLVQSSEHRANGIVVEAYDGETASWIELARTSETQKIPNKAVVAFSRCVSFRDPSATSPQLPAGKNVATSDAARKDYTGGAEEEEEEEEEERVLDFEDPEYNEKDDEDGEDENEDWYMHGETHLASLESANPFPLPRICARALTKMKQPTHPPATSRCCSLLLSHSADVRAADDVTAFEGQNMVRLDARRRHVSR